MRWITSSMTSGAVLIFGAALVFGPASNGLLAQDQPAAGAPPAATTSDAPPSGAQPTDSQSGTAQPDGAPPAAPASRSAPNPERQARMLAKQLALTPEQQSQVESILTDRQQQVESARANATLPPRARRAQLGKIMRSSDGKIESLLSDAQRQQFAQIKQERREKRQMRNQQQADAPPAANNE